LGTLIKTVVLILFSYRLAETDYFVNELIAKYSVPERDLSKKLNVQMIAKNQEI
jgi:hypothetical protein